MKKTLRQAISTKLGLHINDDETLTHFFERLARSGRLDSKTQLQILTLVCEHLDQ